MRKSLRAKYPIAPIESLENRTLLSAASITSLKESTTSTQFGQAVTLTATVAPKTANSAALTGTVTFKENGTAFQTVSLNTSHQAVLNASTLRVGSDTITAIFNGSTAFAASTSSAVTHAVAQSSSKTGLSLSSTSSVIGRPVTLTAAVTAVSPGAGVPSGSVKFSDGSTVLGTAMLDSTGHAKFAVANLYRGLHNITAAFVGTTSYKASTSSPVGLTLTLPSGDTLTSSSLQVSTVVAGSGTAAVAGKFLEVDYTGYLTNGTKFDSSLNAGRTPFHFQLGGGQVIQGWDQGLVGIKVGETRVLIIPPALGYGSQANGSIPANSTLVFIVKLLAFDLPKLSVTGGASGTVPVTNNETATTSNGTAMGSVKVGASGNTVQFAISNTGAAPLLFTANPPIVISGTAAADFVVAQPVISGSEAIFTITFKPKIKGTLAAKVTIYTTDPTFPSFTFNITGTGT